MYRHLLWVAATLLSTCFTAALGQPIHVHPTPSEFGDGDSIRVDFYAGTASDPFGEVEELTLVVHCEGCTFASHSTPEALLIADSWFADDANWATHITYSADRSRLILELTRTDATPRSGYGYVMSLGNGIIINIDDAYKRGPSLRVSVAASPPPLHLARVGDYLQVRGIEGTTSFELLTLQGSLMARGQVAAGAYVGHFPPGIYLCRVLTPMGPVVHKWRSY